MLTIYQVGDDQASSTYIKERPERLTIDEVWLLFEAAAQYKESVDFGLEVIA